MLKSQFPKSLDEGHLANLTSFSFTEFTPVNPVNSDEVQANFRD